MNATSALVMIMILAFAADRLAKGILFCLGFVPYWRRKFPNPEFLSSKAAKEAMRNRHLIAYTVTVGLIAGIAVAFFPEIRIIATLTGPEANRFIDMAVTGLVVMGGSDLVSRIVQISGIGDTGASAAAGESAQRNKPVEIVGRLVIENDGTASISPMTAPLPPEKPATS
jgi:hypothetical protein